MLLQEKNVLIGQFNAEKHHLVVALNIFMFMSRHGILILDDASNGKKYEWQGEKIDAIIDDFMPPLFEELMENQY